MADLSQILMPYLPFEKTQKKMGIKNPILKSLLNPMTIAGMLAGGAGLGMAMAKRGGKKLVGAAMSEAEEAAAKKLLSPGLGSTLEGGPVFHSRLSRALRQIDPNSRIRTYGDLIKAAEKGGGASRVEARLLVEKFNEQASSKAVPGASNPPGMLLPEGSASSLVSKAMSRDTQIGIGNMRSSTLADYLDDNPVLALHERQTKPGTGSYEEFNPLGGEKYQELALSTKVPRPGVDAGAPGYMGHLMPTDHDQLAFLLTKQREFEGIGKSLSVEQLQSDSLGVEHGMATNTYGGELRDVLKRRYPDIAMARAVRKAADEGLEGVTWHPGDIVQEATHGKLSGQEAWYGKGTEPGGRLYDAARKLQKQIPGSRMEKAPLASGSIPERGGHSEVDKLLDDTLRESWESVDVASPGREREAIEIFDNLAYTQPFESYLGIAKELRRIGGDGVEYSNKLLGSIDNVVQQASGEAGNLERLVTHGQYAYMGSGKKPLDANYAGFPVEKATVPFHFVRKELDVMLNLSKDPKTVNALLPASNSREAAGAANPIDIANQLRMTLSQDQYYSLVQAAARKYAAHLHSAVIRIRRRMTDLADVLYESGEELSDVMRTAATEHYKKTNVKQAAVERWLLRLPPEARKAVKKMTFPLLGAAGVMVPNSIGKEGRTDTAR